jgi:hypothetical protein
LLEIDIVLQILLDVRNAREERTDVIAKLVVRPLHPRETQRDGRRGPRRHDGGHQAFRDDTLKSGTQAESFVVRGCAFRGSRKRQASSQVGSKEGDVRFAHRGRHLTDVPVQL